MRNSGIEKQLKNRKIAVLCLIVLALTPGFLTLLYSQTLIYSGFGATDYWWDRKPTPPTHVSLVVSNSTPVVTKTLRGEQLFIKAFNITGGNVSIIVSCETNATIAYYDSITGENIVQLSYPTAKPSGNFDQDFNVTAMWEDSNATITFDYSFTNAVHADETVTWTLPGYEEIRAFGEYLMVGGLVIAGILVSISLITFLVNKRKTDGS